MALAKWRPPLRRLQHGPVLRAWMVALRWVVHCRRVKEHVARLVGQLLIWQDGIRIVNVLADHSVLAKMLVEFARFMHGARGCDGTLQALPAW
eukprot:8556808-Pyramimonas_sp.AAC.1